MHRALLKLKITKSLNYVKATNVERKILDLTYEEYLLKSQTYNPNKQFAKFSELRKYNPKANSLNYKCQFPIRTIIDSFESRIPDFYSGEGEAVLFKHVQLQIIESNIHDRLAHSIQLIFSTDVLLLLDSFGTQLLLGYIDSVAMKNLEQPPIWTNVFTVRLQPDVAISQYQPWSLGSLKPHNLS